jgi:hypothetical protein
MEWSSQSNNFKTQNSQTLTLTFIDLIIDHLLVWPGLHAGIASTGYRPTAWWSGAADITCLGLHAPVWDFQAMLAVRGASQHARLTNTRCIPRAIGPDGPAARFIIDSLGQSLGQGSKGYGPRVLIWFAESPPFVCCRPQPSCGSITCNVVTIYTYELPSPLRNNSV